MIAAPVYLEFLWNGAGSWTAVSERLADDRLRHAEWRIVICEDGTFTAGDSDAELIVGDNRPFFSSLAEAKAWCDREEGNLKENE
jgi:hypothetical protein